MKLWRMICLAVAIAVSGCAAAPAPDWRLAEAQTIAGPEILILTVEEASPEDLAALAAEIERRHGVVVEAEWPLQSIGVHCLVVNVGAQPPNAVVARMEADAEILTVQPMQRFQTLTSATANDLSRLQSGLRKTRAPEVHPMLTGANVRIGIIDTGIDFSHPDLQSRRLDSRDFVGLKGAPPRAEVHGTVVAGVIAADRENASGIVGVAPDAMLLGLRGCWEDASGIGQCSTFSLARALNFAVQMDLNILNLSLTGPFDPLLADLIQAANAKGMIVVAAAGDDEATSFPANQAGVIAAAATTTPQRAQVWAPGEDIISTTPGAGYDFFSGNSVATAHVSGVAALLVQADPALTKDRLVRAIVAGDGPEPPVPIDACAAVAEIYSAPSC